MLVLIVYICSQLKYNKFKLVNNGMPGTGNGGAGTVFGLDHGITTGHTTMTTQAGEIRTDAQTILIADDHPLFRDAMRHAVESQMPNTHIIMAGDFNEVEEIIAGNANADLLLLDLTMPGASGFVGLIRLRAEHPALPVVVVSASDDPATIRRSLDLGASGFIPKSSSGEQIRQAINDVMAGNIWLPPNIDIDSEADDEISGIFAKVSSLTPQQHRVLGMIGDGLLNKQIAYNLGVSEATVKAHVSAVLLKLKVDSRTQAVIQLAKISGAVGTANLGLEPVDNSQDI